MTQTPEFLQPEPDIPDIIRHIEPGEGISFGTQKDQDTDAVSIIRMEKKTLTFSEEQIELANNWLNEQLHRPPSELTQEELEKIVAIGIVLWKI